jgi:hypothetical protein
MEKVAWPIVMQFEIAGIDNPYSISFPEPLGVFGCRKNKAHQILCKKLADRYLHRPEDLEPLIEAALDSAFCGNTYYIIKSGKGKTEKSRKITMRVQKGACSPGYPDYIPPQADATFFVPTSMILRSDGKEYLPRFVVEEKLAELPSRSRYYSQAYERIPVVSPVSWPLKGEYLVGVLAQLPPVSDMLAIIERKKEDARREAVLRAEERKKEDQERLARFEKERVAAAKKARIAAEKKAQHRAKMDQMHNVDVTVWKSYKVKVGKYSRYQKDEIRYKNVSLYFSGTRVYVVFSDGQEIISTRQNVDIFPVATVAKA